MAMHLGASTVAPNDDNKIVMITWNPIEDEAQSEK
jgi:hypothetical protein